MIRLTDLITENFDTIYDKFDKKDYFGTTSLVQTNINNWKRAKEKGDKGADKYTPESIEKIVRANQKKLSKEHTYEKLNTAIKSKDLKYLKSVLRHDQDFSKELFNSITGEKLPKSTKDIATFLDNWKSKSLNEYSIFPGPDGKEIRGGDKFFVVKGYNGRPFDLGIGSHSQNPNSKSLILPKGHMIEFDEVAPNGNVWFYFMNPITGKRERGKSESGSLNNMLKAGVIKKK